MKNRLVAAVDNVNPNLLAGFQLLIQSGGWRSSGKDPVPIDSCKITVNRFAFLYLFYTVDRSDQTLIKLMSALRPTQLDELCVVVIERRRQVRGRTSRHSAADVASVDDDYRTTT